MTNLEGQRMERTYLLDNLASSETRFDGSAVSYSYDSNANIASVDYPDATLAFTHDADGLLTSASNSAGVISNEYDSATGWLISSRGIDGSDVSYGYHLGGGVASISLPAGVVSNTLDVAGRKSELFSPAGNIGFGYCSWNGKLAVVTNVNGTTTSYAYDAMDRVTNITWTTVDGSRIGGFSYVYDAIGRIVSRNHDISTNTFNRSYAYDAMDRLASDGNVSYAYDAADNRIAKTGDVEGDVAYTLGMGNRLQSWTGGSYTYNDAGCVTHIERAGKPTLDLTWDSQYQLISVATNGVFAEGYSYDALGGEWRRQHSRERFAMCTTTTGSASPMWILMVMCCVHTCGVTVSTICWL
jgi:YD repeat-containing protein